MRLWSILPTLALVLTVGTRSAAAEEKGAFGLGLILGEPTGISAKFYLTDTTAVDGALGGAFVSKGIQVHADYLWHPWILTNEEAFVMPAYIGLGARVLQHDRGDDENDLHVGVRVVGGLSFDFREKPIDVFLEVAIIGEFKTAEGDHGGFGPGLNVGLGGRYYF